MGSFSVAIDSITDASFPRNANTSPACCPLQQQPGPLVIAGGRASQWWRQRDSALPCRSIFNYGRIRIPGTALGQSAWHNIPSIQRINRAVAFQTPDSWRPFACSLPVYKILDVAIVTVYFFLPFFAAGPLPLLTARSLVSAYLPAPSPPSQYGPDLWARTTSRRKATHCLTDALSKSGTPLQIGLYHNRATAMTWIMNRLLMYAYAGW